MHDNLNVLLVVLEGARSDHLSCYGYRRQPTPFLDEIAADGVRFPHMITTSPSTLSAHAALWTGRFASATGAHSENPILADHVPVLPEVLRRNGYRTGAFCTARKISPETGFGRGIDDFCTQHYQNRLADRAVSYGRRAGDRLLRRVDAGGRRTNDALRDWIAQGKEPFFAFVHYDETRIPLSFADLPDPDLYSGSMDGADLSSVVQDGDALLAGELEYNEGELDLLGAIYDTALRYIDSRIAELAEFLSETGQWDRTVLVVTADHGQSLGEHAMLGNRVGLYDTLLRVPLLIRCPGHVPKGFVVEELAQTVDVAPTILNILGIHSGLDSQGRVLFEKRGAAAGPDYGIAERFRPDLSGLAKRFPGADIRQWDVRSKAIRTRDTKFIWRADENNELYDLSEDPGEENNLIAQEVGRADELRRKLFDWFADADPNSTGSVDRVANVD